MAKSVKKLGRENYFHPRNRKRNEFYGHGDFTKTSPELLEWMSERQPPKALKQVSKDFTAYREWLLRDFANAEKVLKDAVFKTYSDPELSARARVLFEGSKVDLELGFNYQDLFKWLKQSQLKGKEAKDWSLAIDKGHAISASYALYFGMYTSPYGTKIKDIAKRVHINIGAFPENARINRSKNDKLAVEDLKLNYRLGGKLIKATIQKHLHDSQGAFWATVIDNKEPEIAKQLETNLRPNFKRVSGVLQDTTQISVQRTSVLEGGTIKVLIPKSHEPLLPFGALDPEKVPDATKLTLTEMTLRSIDTWLNKNVNMNNIEYPAIPLLLDIITGAA